MKIPAREIKAHLRELAKSGKLPVGVKTRVVYHANVGMNGQTVIQITDPGKALRTTYGDYAACLTVGLLCEIIETHLGRKYPSENIRSTASHTLVEEGQPYLDAANRRPPTPWSGKLLEAARAQDQALRDLDYAAYAKSANDIKQALE